MSRQLEKEGVKSTRVVQFNRGDKRYKRIGVLVEKELLHKAGKELKIEDDDETDDEESDDEESNAVPPKRLRRRT